MKTVVMATHLVNNYSEWRPKFNNDEAKRQEAGVRLIDVLVSAENENEVTLLFEASDLNKFKSLMSSAELKAGMQAAGVVSEPVVKILFSKN